MFSSARVGEGEGAELAALPTPAINTLERVLRHQGRSASSQRQRKSSRWQQRAHVCAVLRRFDNTSLNGYQPLVVIPLVSTRMSAAAPGKTKRIDTTATRNGSIGCGRPSFEHSERFASSVPLPHQQVRRARARRRTICSPERCSARVGVGEGTGPLPGACLPASLWCRPVVAA